MISRKLITVLIFSTTSLTSAKINLNYLKKYNMIFDISGLNDNKLEENTKKSLANYATRKEYKIKALLLYLHIDDKRFKNSNQEMPK